jgi:F0F1-type ATP synthase membrane subunit b/b'
MTIWGLVLIIGSIAAFGLGFIYLAVLLHKLGGGGKKSLVQGLEGAAKEDVEHIFNNDFREELRNRGRLHFEKILGENAMFLQQDLRLTTSQLNEYMKGEISKNLKNAFDNYQAAITDAKQLAVESIQKTKTAIDEERGALVEQLRKDIEEERARRIRQFDKHMAEVINHYVLAAIGNQIDLNNQLEYILGEMEENKQAILEDIQNGS